MPCAEARPKEYCEACTAPSSPFPSEHNGCWLVEFLGLLNYRIGLLSLRYCQLSINVVAEHRFVSLPDRQNEMRRGYGHRPDLRYDRESSQCCWET
jgi:hypothetical protein